MKRITVFRKGRTIPDAVARRLAEFVPQVELTHREPEVLELMVKGFAITKSLE